MGTQEQPTMTITDNRLW